MLSHNGTLTFNISIKHIYTYANYNKQMFRRQRKARKILMSKILRNSANKQDFEVARLQWRGIEYMQDLSCSSVCECTKKDIKRLWVIYNIKTNKTMKWIGNCCIQHFQIQLTTKRHKRNVMSNNNHNIKEMFMKMAEKRNNEDTNSVIDTVL